MSRGRIWSPEWEDFVDPRSGVSVRQLTNYKGHSHHLYFTNPGWFDNDWKLLFSINLETGEITQLTDFESLPEIEKTSG